ncbi:NAAT family transporter [Thiotrichales bacterium 19S9-12]|nr:NAAT family transporter [Thiotrichales bacterium 19S9-11]MCF6810757.1 NAAT family transporter [Thiotrichales bacterium 19S9-12]
MLGLFISMLVIMNPIGNAAIYISLVSDRDKKEQALTAKICAVAVLAILLVSFWAGWPILKFFGIDIGSLKVAGGIIVLRIALSMLKGGSHTHNHHTEEDKQKTIKKESVAVVPMAIPIIAGPGVISVMIANAHDYEGLMPGAMVSLLCVLAAFIIWIILVSAPLIGRVLGEQGMQIISRVMGLILAAISIEMLHSGLILLFPHVVMY